MKPFALATLLLGVVLLAGCSKAQPRASVSGQVKYLNKPVPTGTVTFVSDEGNAVESGPIQNGQYTIARAPVGPVKITVTTPPAPPAMQSKQKVPGKTIESASAESVAIPAKYSSPTSSGLTYTVTSEASQTHNIDLK